MEICRYNHISIASGIFFSYDEIARHTLPYRKLYITWQSITLFFVSIGNFRSFENDMKIKIGQEILWKPDLKKTSENYFLSNHRLNCAGSMVLQTSL